MCHHKRVGEAVENAGVFICHPGNNGKTKYNYRTEGEQGANES